MAKSFSFEKDGYVQKSLLKICPNFTKYNYIMWLGHIPILDIFVIVFFSILTQFFFLFN